MKTFSVVRLGSGFGLVSALVLLGASACSSGQHGSSGSTTASTRILSATFDGSHVTVVRVAPDDSGPVSPSAAVGAPALDWELTDSSGAVVASGSIADPTHVVSEFSGGVGAPAFASNGTGLFELRVPDVTGGTLTVERGTGMASAPAADAGTSFLQGFPHVQPLGICVSGSSTCSSSSTPVSTSGSAGGTGGAADSGLQTPGLRKVVDNGSCAPFNMLFVSEGYQAGEMKSFEATVQEIASGIGAYKGYAGKMSDFNVWTLEVPSTDSGITDPGCTPPGAAGQDACPTAIPAAMRSTAFGASFGDNVTIPRRATQIGIVAGAPTAMDLFASAKREARIDVTGFILNSMDSGGSADIPGHIFTTTTYVGTDGPTPTTAHETGHALFHFVDEYEYGSTADDCASEAKVNGAGGPGPLPLINATSTPGSPSWASIVSTPPVQGAYYCMAGFYRPTSTCLMYTLGNNEVVDFCPVCLAHANDVIKAKEDFARCSCGQGADAGADAAPAVTADSGGGLVIQDAGPLLCPSGDALLQQATAKGWYPF